MITIKRYSNRKLYNLTSRQYITLEEIAALVRGQELLKIIDHETGEDITAATLAQIIFNQEKNGTGIFSPHILRKLIQAGEDTVSQIKQAIFQPPAFLFEYELESRLAHLVSTGQLSSKEAAHWQQLLESAPSPGEKSPGEQEFIQADMSADLQELIALVDSLIQDVEDLKSQRDVK